MTSERKILANRRNLAKANEARRKDLVVKACENCGGEMQLVPSNARRRFCSWSCRQVFMRGPNAPNAGKGEAIRGFRNPRWKGGIPRSGSRDPQVAAWRKAVYARDNYTCQMCGLRPKRKGQLRAHHRVPWSVASEYRFDLDNGLTLCRDCHNALHRTVEVGDLVPDLAFICPPNVRILAHDKEAIK